MATQAQIQRLATQTHALYLKNKKLADEAEHLFGHDDDAFIQLANGQGFNSEASLSLQAKLQNSSARKCACRRQ